ncbi:hypothetical protein AAF712_011887 [Marasmius tenuissimus]|uniref:CN hydrolase domain-containing protein n=1 Tax=Marasmius tenuissimus TaxID=585030 RepID=A0ABR2ZJD0_9AGAR
MKVAAIQAEPVWLDLDGTIEKVISLCKEAASNGVELIGFPEAFIPGYPWRTWSSAYDPVFFTKYLKNCLSLQSPQYQRLMKGVKEAGIWAVVGFVERDGDSMYCAQSIINPSGRVVLHRRKLKATGHERTFWGDGPADSLLTSVKGPEGVIIGCLACGEHYLPLLRFHHYTQGVQVHVASWPLFDSIKAGYARQFASDTHATATRYMATEGPLFVICSTQVIKPENRGLCGIEGTAFDIKEGGGFAAIYAPDGRDLVKPLASTEEGILYADIDLDEISTSKLVIDPAGHYSRPDLLSLNVNTTVNPLVRQHGKKEQEYELLARIPQLTED